MRRDRPAWARLLAGAACALVLTGCTSGADTPPAKGTEPPRKEAPSDRDGAAVLAALRQLDLCAVLAAAKGGGTPSGDDPFSCGVAGVPDVSVSPTFLDTDARLKLPTREIGGARAYVAYEIYDTCKVYLPVSFTLALEFDVSREGPGVTGCGATVTETVVAAVAALADPPARAAGPHWDSCTALGKALDKGADDLITGEPIGASCSARNLAGSLRFAYGYPLVGAGTPGTVAGIDVTIKDPDGDLPCELAWPTGTTEPEEWVAVAAVDCASATKLAEAVIPVLAAAPPETPAPQRPLLYAAAEPDTPYVGACAHLEQSKAKHCQPFEEVAVPNGTEAILRAADRDTNLHCAVAKDGIAERFGTQLVPVAMTDGDFRHCYFVEPDRRLQIDIQIMTNQVDGLDDVFTSARETEIAGHPGYVEARADRLDYQVWVALTDDPRARGGLSIQVEGGPASRGAVVPAEAAAKVEQVVTDILAEHFS